MSVSQSVIDDGGGDDRRSLTPVDESHIADRTRLRIGAHTDERRNSHVVSRQSTTGRRRGTKIVAVVVVAV